MNIEEIRNLKSDLERRLKLVAEEAVEDFQKQTGLAVSGVSIDLVSVRTVSVISEVSLVVGCKIHVEV